MGDSVAGILSQGVGYGVVIGLGFLFALGMIGVTAGLRRYQKEIITSEEFATAGRSVKSGLIAAAVVSSWTWAATLLTSSGQAYKNGVSGAFWYASGATVQIILFATLAIELKRKAPGAHTYLELVKVRYGAACHIVFCFFAVATNFLVTAMLLAGGSAVVSDVTGMNTIAAIWLLPLFVVIYTVFGGLKATFLTDYVHTVVLIVIIMIFALTTYAAGDKLGSPGKVYDLLVQAGKDHPVTGNHDGSYLTMKSKAGGIFFVINIVGNFGTVFLDNGYWNKAIAASPVAALPGYLLGGLAWFAVPFLTSTTMGLACLALESNPAFPTYPNRLSADEVSSGLVLPSAAIALLGKSGGVCTLLLVFMAVTSASSAEFIAFSSVFTYDIYKGYINPKATGKQLIWISHMSICGFSIVMAAVSIALWKKGVSMGYLYVLMGIIISGAVFPAAMTIMSRRQTRLAATISPILGFIFAIIGWLVRTKVEFNEFTIASTGSDYPMLIGNVVALLSPMVFSPLISLYKPYKFDWNELKKITKVDETEELAGFGVNDGEKGEQMIDDVVEGHGFVLAENTPEEQALLDKYAKVARIITAFMAIAFLVIWPMPMYGSGYIFSKPFFRGWVVVGIIWIFISSLIVNVFPLWQGRYEIYNTLRGIYWDVTGQSYKLKAWQESNPEELHVHMSRKSIIEEVNGQELEGDSTNSPTESIKK